MSFSASVVGDNEEDGSMVGNSDGSIDTDGSIDGVIVGTWDGTIDGTSEGSFEGKAEGSIDGVPEGSIVGVSDGVGVLSPLESKNGDAVAVGEILGKKRSSAAVPR